MTTKNNNLAYKELLEKELEKIIPNCILSTEINYSVASGGKRFRAILCFIISDIFKLDLKFAISSAISLELIHAYSLVHDDLPAMDDDDLRRGKPTLHKQFNEATAILVGDGLQTLTFKTIADDNNLSNEVKIKLIQILANASFDMVLGQKIDIDNNTKTLDELINLHKLKTGALIKASILMGATVAGVKDIDYQILSKVADNIGLAYQVQDDVLDLEDSDKIGKTSSSDKENNKITFISFLGEKKAAIYYNDLYNKALDLTKKLSVNANKLNNLIKIMQNRDF